MLKMRNIVNDAKVVLSNGFFSKSNIESIMTKAKLLNFESKGTIIDKDGNVSYDKNVRNSSNCNISNEHEISVEIYKCLEMFSEGFYGTKTALKDLVDVIDIVRYNVGERVTEHLDAFVNKNFVGANREYSLMVGLQEAEEGGLTVFPKIGQTHKVKAGEVLVWRNLDDNGKADYNTVHKGTEVIKGTKYIAILFIKQQK